MFDLKWLNGNLDFVRERTAWRKAEVDFRRLDELLDARRDLIHDVESTRHAQRQAQVEMKSLDKKSDAFNALRTELKALSNRVKALEEQRRAVADELEALVLTIPNVTHESVPRGDGEDDNVELKRWGEPRKFDFEIDDHVAIGERLGVLDLDAGSKVARARFAFLFGTAARLSRSLIEFMLDLHTREHGYTEVLPPFLVNRDAMTGTGQLPKFEDDAFATDDLFLIPTAEVPVTNLLRDEILDGDRLPLKYAAYSPCFRRAAGSYGVDTRGLIRQHQFEKVELVKFTRPEDSYNEHETLVRDAERVLQLLELPYRVIDLCTADIGFSAAKCLDLEVWIPSQNRYREISSCSNFESFQARRANIRFSPPPQAKPELVHTLNGSGLAIGRTIVAILENYQNRDGSVTVPEVLVDRMGTDRLRPPT